MVEALGIIIILFALAHVLTIYMIYELGVRMTELQNKQYIGIVSVSNKIIDLLSITNSYLEKLSKHSENNNSNPTLKTTIPTQKEKEHFKKRAQ
jgi:hypothetical protein